MKKILFLLLLMISTIAYTQFVTPQKIMPHSYVQDYDGVLNSAQILNLNQRIDTITRHYSVQIAVVILSNLQNNDIADAALSIGRTWGVGVKDTNNGIVYLIAPKLHKARLEIGYGLEGNIPDITAQDIGNSVTPYYKDGKWYEGIESLLSQVTEKLDKKPDIPIKTSAPLKAYLIIIGLVLFLLILYCIIRYYNHHVSEEDDYHEPEPEDDNPDKDINEHYDNFLLPFTAGAIAASYHDKYDYTKEYKQKSSDEDDSPPVAVSFDDDDGSYSKTSSDDDSDSFGSFGGGSFGGGGATSNW